MDSLYDTIYTPLPVQSQLGETRIVVLRSGQWDDEISCTLKVTALNARPEFEALSYVWGNHLDVRPILLNGHAFSVATNMESALRHFRSTTESRTLWIDAVCINQRAIAERNAQVALMRDIYFRCRGVLIWLGEVDRATPCEWLTDFAEKNNSATAHVHREDIERISAFEFIIKGYYRLPFALRHSIHIDNITGAFCLMSLLAQNKHVNSADIPFLSNHDAFHRIILALHEVMSRAWWVRQWVIQEIVLPPKATLHYGKVKAPWELFAHAARNYEHHRKTCCESHYTYLHGHDIRLLENFSRTILELDNLRQESQRPLKDPAIGDPSQISLRQLLWQFRERDTSDPRDKVFTLLTLVNYWAEEKAIFPDYNLTTEAIYRLAVEKIIAVDDSLLILMGNTEKTMSGLPTWVPDWTAKSPRFELERLERTHLFDASGGRKLKVEVIEQSILGLSGVFFDTVVAISGIMEFDDLDETLQIFSGWYDLVSRDQPMASDYVAGGSRMEAYWRTLCMDTARTLDKEEVALDKAGRYSRCGDDYVHIGTKMWMDDRGLPLASPSAQPGSGVNMDLLRRLSSISQAETSREEGLNFVAVDFAITSATMHRRLFLTERGYMGLGPASMKEGDAVFVFAGGQMPFVVRNAGSRDVPGHGDQECRELVGDCYVHGIMDGELMKQYEENKQVVYLL